MTACDIANLPLADGSLHVAIFCLSLMGANYEQFLREAHRVLRPQGVLKVAEVKSRYEDVSVWIKMLRRIGFDLARAPGSQCGGQRSAREATAARGTAAQLARLPHGLARHDRHPPMRRGRALPAA